MTLLLSFRTALGATALGLIAFALPEPALDLIGADAYRRKGRSSAMVITSRGCPNRCTYCGQWRFWRTWRHREPEAMAAELQLLHERHELRGGEEAVLPAVHREEGTRGRVAGPRGAAHESRGEGRAHEGEEAAVGVGVVEEEVVRWLCDLVGYGEGSFGLFTSGGVMANIMSMNVARDVHLRRVRGLDGPPRGADLTAARVYVSDQAHFSIKRSLDTLGFPEGTLVKVPADERLRLQAAPVAEVLWYPELPLLEFPL